MQSRVPSGRILDTKQRPFDRINAGTWEWAKHGDQAAAF
jgi:hypothetical protein